MRRGRVWHCFSTPATFVQPVQRSLAHACLPGGQPGAAGITWLINSICCASLGTILTLIPAFLRVVWWGANPCRPRELCGDGSNLTTGTLLLVVQTRHAQRAARYMWLPNELGLADPLLCSATAREHAERLLLTQVDEAAAAATGVASVGSGAGAAVFSLAEVPNWFQKQATASHLTYGGFSNYT